MTQLVLNETKIKTAHGLGTYVGYEIDGYTDVEQSMDLALIPEGFMRITVKLDEGHNWVFKEFDYNMSLTDLFKLNKHLRVPYETN